MSKEAEELALKVRERRVTSAGLAGGLFGTEFVNDVEQSAVLIDAAFAKVREEYAEMATEWYRDDCGGCGGQCDGACSHIDSLRAAILGTEAKD